MFFGNIGPYPPYLSPYNLFNNPSLEFPSQGTVTEQVTLIWFYLKKIDEILDKMDINIKDVYDKQEIDDKIGNVYSVINNNKVASEQSDSIINQNLNTNVSFLQNQINENKIKEVKIKEDQSMIFLHPNLKTKNNSFKIKNYYIINIDIHNTGNEMSVNSNNLLAIFDEPELLNISDEALSDNMYVLQSYSQMLTRDVNFGKLGTSPTGIITGDSGITFPAYKTVKIFGVIKL